MREVGPGYATVRYGIVSPEKMTGEPEIEGRDVRARHHEVVAEAVPAERVLHELFEDLKLRPNASVIFQVSRVCTGKLTFSDNSWLIEYSIPRCTTLMLFDVGAAGPAETKSGSCCSVFVFEMTGVWSAGAQFETSLRGGGGCEGRRWIP